jgi:hypothetical protein
MGVMREDSKWLTGAVLNTTPARYWPARESRVARVIWVEVVQKKAAGRLRGMLKRRKTGG